MTMRIAHIINPVQVPPQSDLFTAQPVTFAAMRQAQQYAAGTADVQLFTTQYPEDHAILPDGFTVLPDLERSVLDLAALQPPRKLPILRDILQRLYDATDADILVYSNADIAPMPYFYSTAARLLQDQDALIINRRTIEPAHSSPDDLALMYAQAGKKHGGWDCFVFRRELLPRLQLSSTFIGMVGVGLVLVTNLAAFAPRYQELTDAHLTFHLGDDRVWSKNTLVDYQALNRQFMRESLLAVRDSAGPLNETTAHGRFLLDVYRYAWRDFLYDLLLLDNPAERLKIQQPSLLRRTARAVRARLGRYL